MKDTETHDPQQTDGCPDDRRHLQVVVGVDGSPSSRAAAEFGAREATRRGVALELVHAYDLPVYAADPMGTAYRRCRSGGRCRLVGARTR